MDEKKEAAAAAAAAEAPANKTIMRLSISNNFLVLCFSENAPAAPLAVDAGVGKCVFKTATKIPSLSATQEARRMRCIVALGFISSQSCRPRRRRRQCLTHSLASVSRPLCQCCHRRPLFVFEVFL